MAGNTPIYFKENVSKYNIPLDHLDFAYISKCNDVKELEKIYKLLKSGEEGTYVDLEKCCEEKLRKLHPNSRALRKPIPLLNISDINKAEREDLEDDLKSWTNNMATLDNSLKNMASKTLDPQTKQPIRSSENLKAENETTRKKKPPSGNKKPSMPRGYKEWDKFDIDKELTKADEIKTEEKKKTPKSKLNLSEEVDVNPDELEDTKLSLATREKEKGNEAFRSSDFNEAVIYYNRSLSILPSDAVYNNRALVYLKLQRWDDAISDCNKVLDNENDNIKALLRRATAYKEKREFNKSICDLKQVLVLEPENQRAKQILQEVESSCPSSDNKTKTASKKKKGRKMLIEDIEGNNSEEEEGKKSSKILDKNQANLEEAKIKKEEEKTNNNNNNPEVNTNDLSKGKGDNQSRKSSKQKKNLKNKIDAKSSMSGGDNLKNKNDNEIVDSKAREVTLDSCPPLTDQPLNDNDSEKKKACQDACVNDKKPSKSEEDTSEKCPLILTHWPLPPKVESIKKSGNDMFQKGRYAEALKFYTNAIELLEEKSSEQTVNLSLIYSNRAACCLKMGNCQASIDDCSTSLKLVPHSIKPLLRRAAAYETLERYGLAYIDYKHVLSVNSAVEVALQGSARCSQTLIQFHGYSWREKLPPIVMVQASDIPVIHNALGSETTDQRPHPPSNEKASESPSNENKPSSKTTTKKGQKKSEKAEQGSMMNESQSSNPEKKVPKSLTKDEEFDLMKSKGNQHVKNEEYQKAIECYTKCVQLFPDKVVSYTNRALCYLKLNQASKAESDCDKSLKKDPNNIKAMFRRAQAKKLKQHYRESIGDLKNLLSMDPKNSAAKKELEVVKNFWRQELNEMKANMADANKDCTKCPHDADSSSNGIGKKAFKQRTRIHVHDVDEDKVNNNGTPTSNSSNNSSSSQSKPIPVASNPKSHGKHHKNSTPKKTEGGSTQQNQALSNNKKPCKSGGRTAPPPPVAAPHIDKATPYEFLKAWNSLKTVRNTKPYADLLAQVAPEDLPKMISNKLDAPMLNLITRCVSEHYADRGTAELGLQILSNVTQVERFQTIAMFMSSKEKSDLLSLLETLAANQTLFGEEEMQKLKNEFGLK